MIKYVLNLVQAIRHKLRRISSYCINVQSDQDVRVRIYKNVTSLLLGVQSEYMATKYNSKPYINALESDGQLFLWSIYYHKYHKYN